MRYKEYNVNRVLEQAIRLFWEHSFMGCSINTLVEETGVNRFSLYHEFENKEGILYASLKLYKERYCDQKFSILKEEGEMREILKKFYLSFLQTTNTIPGCYFIHIGTELADSDEKIKSILEAYLQEMEDLFIQLLNKNNYAGEQANILAKHLIGLYCTSTSFCLIHTESQRDEYIENGINVIFKTNG